VRRAFFGTVVFVAFVACGESLTLSPASPDAGALDATTPVVRDDDDDVVSAPDADADADADADPPDDPACAHCNSKRCETDGGCWPYLFVTEQAVPGDLNPGDSGRSGPERGDDICNAEAKSAGRSGVYHAWLSAPGATAANHQTGVRTRPYVRGDGRAVALNLAAFTKDIQFAPQSTADGTFINNGTAVWTGTNADGGVAADTCGGFTTFEGTQGMSGIVNATDPGWTQKTSLPCGGTAHLYCFEAVQ
jgi:hypothetical protein